MLVNKAYKFRMYPTFSQKALISKTFGCTRLIFNKMLEDGFKRYYKKLGGMPKFKKKGINSSYRTNNITNVYKNKTYNSISIDLKKKEIILPKLKEVKIRGYRNYQGE